MAVRSPKGPVLRILGVVIIVIALVASVLGSSLMSASGAPSTSEAVPHIVAALALLGATSVALLLSIRRVSPLPRSAAIICFGSALAEVLAGGAYLSSGFENGIAAALMENLVLFVLIGAVMLLAWGQRS